jgi:hypothetical protein
MNGNLAAFSSQTEAQQHNTQVILFNQLQQ